MLSDLGASQSRRTVEFTDRSESTPPSKTLYRVLLVEDDERTYHLIRDILETFGDVSIVGRASDGKEAVSLAHVHQPDVILMDINLPSLDGIQATYAIKENSPHTLIIALTGHFTPTLYSAMRMAGAAAFVCKREVLGIHEMILSAMGLAKVRHSQSASGEIRTSFAFITNIGKGSPMLQCAHCLTAFGESGRREFFVTHGTCQHCSDHFQYLDQLRRDHARAALSECLASHAGLNWRSLVTSCIKFCLSHSLVSRRGRPEGFYSHREANSPFSQ